jgi:acyl-ACP thioesterase
MIPRDMAECCSRTVRFTDLDVNGHMNNCRYLDWIDDLLPSGFHKHHQIREFSLCYLSEIREGETLDLHWELSDGPVLNVEAVRPKGTDSAIPSRVFSAKLELQNVVL